MQKKFVAAGAAVAAAGVLAAVGLASGSDGHDLTGVPAAAVKASGFAPASQISPELREAPVAVGSMPLENPQGIVTHYGYENSVPSPENPAVPQMVPDKGRTREAQKTEPDKNTYLVLGGQTGADPHYYYGTHFLFQGHEVGAPIAGTSLSQGYLTRINLDADTAHRVTLMAATDATGTPIQGIDGSTWDPWAKRLVLTTENPNAPTYAATATFPSTVTDVSGALGRGGYEGVQDDGDGDLWIVEDVGGANKLSASGASTPARRPNSFIFRYVPSHRGDLAHGRLQVLQVVNDAGQPITFDTLGPTLSTPDQLALHT
jgi:hypothetical protein